MSSWTKGIWILGTLVNVLSMTWFFLGSTANFNRSLDLVATVVLVIAGIPSLALSILSIVLLKKGWVPSTIETNVAWYIMVILLFLLPIFLFQGVRTKGWLYENTRSDSPKITTDQKYEYRIDLINLWQRDSRGRLYVRNLATGEVKKIPVGIHTDRLVVLGEEMGINNWVLMEPTNRPNHYKLSTTKDLSIPEEKFEIDVEAGTSRSLE